MCTFLTCIRLGCHCLVRVGTCAAATNFSVSHNHVKHRNTASINTSEHFALSVELRIEINQTDRSDGRVDDKVLHVIEVGGNFGANELVRVGVGDHGDRPGVVEVHKGKILFIFHMWLFCPSILVTGSYYF